MLIVVPAALVLAATIVVVAVSLSRMAHTVNTIESRLTLRSTEAALATGLQRLGQSHRDYAEWDDAVRNLYGTINEGFFSESYSASSATQAFFDTVYVLDEEREVVAATRLGRPLRLSVEEAFSPAIDELIDDFALDGHVYDVRTGFVRGALGLAKVAVGPIMPASPGFEFSQRHRLLVLSKSLDAPAISMLAGEYLIDGLRIVAASENPQPNVKLVDPSGKAVATVTWSPSVLGTRAHADVSPLVMLMFSLIGLTVAILVTIAIRGLNKIKTSEDKARHAAAHDALTGLANRGALLRLIDETINGPRAEGGAQLIYMDLDGFKEVNDAYGHDVGDRLLCNIAAGLQSLCGDWPVARIGGDEFAVLSPAGVSLEKATDTARLLVRYLSQPLEIDGRVIAIGTSIGVATIDESVLTSEEAVRRADVAMYQAKEQGRNRICQYDPLVDIERLKRLEIATELGNALRTGTLELAYQPVYNATNRRVIGAEALLRWPREGGEFMPASEFMPVAEETGLIDELGAWVLRRACRDAKSWPGFYVAVNVSPAQLRNPNFEGLVHRVLNESNFQADRLELEVTENYLISNPVQARQSIDAIRRLGVSVALDDFGTGYSSIGYLRSFSFDKLKLDRSLIADIATDRRAQGFVQATVALAESLELDVVAEGVETEEQAMLLRLAGCRALQGFFLSKPRSAAELSTMFDADLRSADLIRLPGA